MAPVLPQIEPPAFEYAVVETCPAEAEARMLFPEAPGRTRVVVWFDGRAYGGRVTFLDPDYAPAERTLNGPTCKVVLEALALSMSVARDVEAQKQAPSSPPTDVEASPPKSVPGATARVSASSFLRGADLGTAIWVGAQPGIAVAASLAIVVGSTRPEHGVWAPRLRIGYAASFPSSGTPNGSAYSFVTRLDACPVEFGNQHVAFVPCMRQDLGVLASRSSDFVAATGIVTSTQFWVSRTSRLYLGVDVAGLVSWRPRSYNASHMIGQFGLSIGISTN